MGDAGVDFDAVDEFAYSLDGLTTTQAIEQLTKHGPNALPEQRISKTYLFFSQLWQPMPTMIWVAVTIETAIANYADAGILLAIQLVNASVGCAPRLRCNATLSDSRLNCEWIFTTQ